MPPALRIDPRDSIALPTAVAISAGGRAGGDGGDEVFEIIVAISSFSAHQPA